jgi:hypothetical protein
VRSGSAGATESASSPDNLSTVARIGGIFRRPRATLEAVAEAPRSAGLLAVLFVVPFAASAALFATDVGQQALVDHWERTALAFGQPVDDARYAELQALSRQGTAYAALTALAAGPIAAVALGALLFGIFTVARRGTASYRQVLAVVASAGVILALRSAVSAPLSYARESIASPTTLVGLLAMVDEASPSARFLGLIDLFVLWWLVVLAIGIALLYRRPTRTMVLTFVGVYIGVALLLAGTMAALGGVS